MSQFSEMLKKLVEDNGITVYKLAKDAGLDRTTIQRSLSGERLPGVSFVQRLCDYMRVSPAERNELMELYVISKIGEDIYNGRKCIEKIIEQIAELHIYQNTGQAVKKTVEPFDDLAQGAKAFVGQYAVNKLIREVLEDEGYNSHAPDICLCAPFAFSYLYDCLHQLYWEQNGNLSITHLIAFHKNPYSGKNPNMNLLLLSSVLPFAFCMGNGYQPYYHYNSSQEETSDMSAMPFYFLTTKHLVTISADFKSAILYNDLQIISIYRKHFCEVKANSNPLVQKLSGIVQMLAIGFDTLFQDQRVAYVIEPQPCLGKYYTEEMGDLYMREDLPNRKELKLKLLKLYDHYKNFNPPTCSFFTTAGLKSFVETGIMADLPLSFAIPFSVKTRLYLLTSLRDDIQQDTYFSRAIDTSKLQVSHIATIQSYGNRDILFLATSDRGIVACMINEQSICDAFNDFFESLPESNLLYTKEDTLSLIDEMLDQLKAMEKQY